MLAEYLIAPPEMVAATAGGATKGGMTEEELDMRLQELELKTKAEQRCEVSRVRAMLLMGVAYIFLLLGLLFCYLSIYR